MSQNNTHITTVYAGVDVAKAKLDLSFQGTRHCVPNNPKGHQKLLGIIQDAGPAIQAHFILEATGGYEAAFAASLHAALVPVSIIQPARVRYFAQALNQHAKTDGIDSDVLVAFGSAVKPAAMQPAKPQTTRLAELVTRRCQLVENKVQNANYAEHYVDKLALKQNQQLQVLLEKQIQACDAAIAQQIADDAQMSADNKRLQQVSGVGPITAAKLIAYMPELGRLSAEAAAALAGVAPYNNDSGPRQGTRSVRGGRKEVRCALYMAALSAVKHEPILARFYARMIGAGKKPLVALTAAMRKLIVLLNHMLKNRDFQLLSGEKKAPEAPGN